MTDLKLTTLRNVPILKTGTFQTSTGEFEFTTADLKAAVEAAKTLPAPRVKLGHAQEWADGEPALGSVQNLRVDAAGTTLLGDLVGVPSWLAKIAASAYPNRSIEAEFDHEDSTGKVHALALTALALLGVESPAVDTLPSLKDVQALYDVAAKGSRRRIIVQTGDLMPTKIKAAATNTTDPAVEPEQGRTLEPEQWTALCAAAGVDENETTLADLAEAIVAAMSAAPESVKASRGTVQLSRVEHQALVIAAEDGKRAVEAAETQERERFVLAAVKDGKITPARRKHWENLIRLDPETRKVLAALPKGMAVHTTEIGHSGEPDIQADPREQLYQNGMGQMFGKAGR